MVESFRVFNGEKMQWVVCAVKRYFIVLFLYCDIYAVVKVHHVNNMFRQILLHQQNHHSKQGSTKKSNKQNLHSQRNFFSCERWSVEFLLK